MAGVVAEADRAEVGETMSPTEADAVSPMVSGAVRQSIRAVVAVMVCGVPPITWTLGLWSVA